MLLKEDKNKARQKRHLRVRKHVSGTAARPRLNVYRSLANIYAQIIDDARGHTIASASTLDLDLKGQLKTGADQGAAALVGKLVAERAVKAGIKEVVFDRGAYIYHGRVKALAEAAREAGLSF